MPILNSVDQRIHDFAHLMQDALESFEDLTVGSEEVLSPQEYWAHCLIAAGNSASSVIVNGRGHKIHASMAHAALSAMMLYNTVGSEEN